MSFFRSRNKRIKICVLLFTFVVAVTAVCGIYVTDYYHADRSVADVFALSDEVEIATDEEGNVIRIPENVSAGFIFYPGGKVEHTAYTPLIKALADRGILCVITEMPFNLAVLDINAADGIAESFPDVEDWYIGGHSLGGSMAAVYAEKHSEQLKGLVLLGAYSTADLTDNGIRVLSVYGSEDSVMNRDKYNEYITNLPSDYKELIIEGGCHAYFGMYGAQEGDGTPSVTNEEQIMLTADAISAMIAEH